MKKVVALIIIFILALTVLAQTPPPTDKKADPKDPEKAEQEPRPVQQELQKQESQKKDAPPQPQPAPLPAGAVAPATEPEKKDAKKWDVMNPPGPSYDIPIDVTTGTWMSLDVSPEGNEILFDLLGDLYTIPMSGGEAKAVTSGVAWDMQPRYSPNGKWIAFTSDRSGGDNLWVMNRDGSEPKQVSSESFRLLNQPAWSPDSEYLVGRKHFTSERSLGAGEMWIYHRTGGDGLQLTKKRTDQKDSGEPVFSPDGRYVYFSDDATSGGIFEYSKDPNAQIYVIQRLDRETGDLDRYVVGPGGSIRPTPSPDGKSLAFIRRVRYQSTLYIKDLESGRETPIFSGLDRDMQETWAVHGVYPSMAWTPDNKSLVFWAGGKIHRIDVASKQVTDIPFHVKSSRRVVEAVRFPVEVAPKNFNVKMLRWVRTSPNGKQVLYQALGYVWVKDLPSGTPRRVTRQTDEFEFYPSWSRDGKSIVYVTWSDEKFGSVRVAPASGGEGRAVTPKPGHYIEPQFSPDGSKIVYRTTSDGYLRPNLYADETAIFVIPAAGGTPTRVSKRGALPMFGASNDRIFFVTFEDEGKRALRSIDLDGSDEREHAMSAFATEFAISPDEKWLAWVEKFDVQVTPFVRTGKSIEIAPGMKAVPSATVTKDAGEYLHWSGDSQRVYWSLGPELFSRDLKDAFAWLADGVILSRKDGEGSSPGATGKVLRSAQDDNPGVNIGFSRPYDVPSGKLAFTNARIITMRGDEVIENGTVVVDGNRITAVGANIAVPADAKVIDAAGKTIMPGIVDVHWHGSMGSDQIIPQQNWILFAALGFGVTTIHDPSNDSAEIFSASEMAKAGQLIGPRIFSTGTILYGAKSPYKADIDSLDDALAHLRRMKAVGAFSVKSYNQPRRDQRQQVIEAARQTSMMVVPEGGSLFQHNMTMVVDGHTGVEHSIPVAHIYDDVLQLWPKTRVGYTPTLIVGYGGSFGENYWYQKTNVYDDPRLTKFVPRRILDSRSRRRGMIPDEEYNHVDNARIAKQLNDAGVSVQLGAHGQREGLGAHWEMWMMAQGGMPPMQVLRVATINGARYLAMDKDIGSLEAGKLADLIVLDRNPLENIQNTHSVRYTVVNGRVYDSATMNELGNHPRTRKPLFFELQGYETWGTSVTAAATHDED
jgi:imidazolonepropionase-like amidohydrolase/Tol biopolymer transport system component